jgi:SAM-dependent methyltransferase
MGQQTINYYEQNAEDFYNRTVGVDLGQVYDKFLEHIPDNGHILDAGCGSGRDSLYFLQQGYRVTAFDAAPQMVELSSQLIDQPVLCAKFQEIDFTAEFDGIWACASLLHVSRSNIKQVFSQLIDALVAGGVIYASFKHGNREVTRNGRFFNYYDQTSFNELIAQLEGVSVINTWQTLDARKERTDQSWFNVLIQKNS